MKHHSSDVTRIANEVLAMDEDEMYDVYGIVLNEDGSVYDETEDVTFDTLTEWAVFVVEGEQTSYGNVEKIGRRRRFDDDDF